MQLFHASGWTGRRGPALGLGMLVLLVGAMVGQAQDRVFRVARLSLVEGEVSYQRTNDSRTDWFDATMNLPLDESDQVYSGPGGRAEIQFTGHNLVRISRNTNLRFTKFNAGTIQFALPIGTATFRIDSLDKRQFATVDANDPGLNDPVYFEVDTPTVAITFVKEGDYRINVREDGTTEVLVRRGQAEVYNQDIGTLIVKKGRRAVVDARDNDARITGLDDKDEWDRWNDRRNQDLFSRAGGYQSPRYVPVSVPGVYDLDAYGDWIDTGAYGWAWVPRGLGAGWAPYRAGYWRWYPLYGWTWVSYEPWGWVPYHYGSWTYWGDRWCWVPRLSIGLNSGWGWRPHLVAFYGWGGGYNQGYRDGYRAGYRDGRWDTVGWVPLGPRDRYHGPGTPFVGNDGRGIEALSNYNVPGGVNRLDGRRFENGRVVFTTQDLNASSPTRPAPRDARGGQPVAAPTLVRNLDDLKPTQTAPARNTLVERADVVRKIEAPVVIRRPVDPTSAPGGAFSRPARNPAPGADARPARSPEYRSVERSDAPIWRSNDARKAEPNGTAPTVKSRDEAPRRNDPVATPRTESREPRRVDPPPSPARSERSLPPSSPPRDSAPRRDSAPAPAPTRNAEPTRAPSSPSRDSTPAKSSPPPERSKPDKPR